MFTYKEKKEEEENSIHLSYREKIINHHWLWGWQNINLSVTITLEHKNSSHWDQAFGIWQLGLSKQTV